MAKRKSKALNNAVEVDIVSDFVCPWCWLGYKLFLKGAEQARKQLKTQINLSWRPYMLDPNVPETGVDYKDYMAKNLAAGLIINSKLCAQCSKKKVQSLAFNMISAR